MCPIKKAFWITPGAHHKVTQYLITFTVRLLCTRAWARFDPWYTNHVIGWEIGDDRSSLFTRPQGPWGTKINLDGWKCPWHPTQHQVDNCCMVHRTLCQAHEKKGWSNAKLGVVASNAIAIGSHEHYNTMDVKLTTILTCPESTLRSLNMVHFHSPLSSTTLQIQKLGLLVPTAARPWDGLLKRAPWNSHGHGPRSIRPQSDPFTLHMLRDMSIMPPQTLIRSIHTATPACTHAHDDTCASLLNMGIFSLPPYKDAQP